MKISKVLLLGLSLAFIAITGCAQDSKAKMGETEKPIMKKEATLEMNKDSLDSKVIADMEKQVAERKIKLTEEALTAISETRSLIENIDNKGKAIKKGHELIGRLEVLLARDPSLALIPIDVSFQKEEFVTDIETIRETVKLAQEAMDKGYYRAASDLLKDMRSEMIISTYLLPTATYPKAIKAAVVLLEENKPKEAKALLESTLSTIVIERDVEPLPILNAEQMIIEAALIDKKDHNNVDKVINLLNNAEYQLTLAEEMGYGKKDKDYKALAYSIDVLKKSVKKKENSESKFDVLKKDIKKFKEKLFSSNKKSKS